jgi:hypothetical protein
MTNKSGSERLYRVLVPRCGHMSLPLFEETVLRVAYAHMRIQARKGLASHAVWRAWCDLAALFEGLPTVEAAAE